MTSSDRPYDVLLLDFGGVCLLTPFELHRYLEAQLGLPHESVTWMGPFDPSTDDLWRELFADAALKEREYWHRRAGIIGDLVGRPLSTADYVRILYEPPRPELVRHEANHVVQQAQAAGMGVSILTNDLRAFHGTEWEKSVPLLQRVDHIVDCSDTHILKPDPRAYERAIEFVGVSAERVLFVDDQPLNVQGAAEFGMSTLWFDVTHAKQSWDEVAQRIGLPG
jgi:putative hydrolase of the HAD superfamily